MFTIFTMEIELNLGEFPKKDLSLEEKTIKTITRGSRRK